MAACYTVVGVVVVVGVVRVVVVIVLLSVLFGGVVILVLLVVMVVVLVVRSSVLLLMSMGSSLPVLSLFGVGVDVYVVAAVASVNDVVVCEYDVVDC